LIKDRAGSQPRSSEMSQDKRIVSITPNAQQACRVLIVDRDSMSSDLLAKVLVHDCGFETAAVQSDQLSHALSTSEVDLVVIGAELSSKSGDGFDLADSVGRTHPDTFIVLLLNQTTHESVIRAFRSGARGVFSRQQPMADFLDCVEHVRKGLIWAGREETNSLLEAFKNFPVSNPFAASDTRTLTARELQVVQLAAKGKTNKTIANELGLSEHTVKNYLFRAFEKLGVSSRVELLFYLTLKGHTFSPAKIECEDGNLAVERS
jgi:two-component system, NarL family, nitrate/nitrite response regulator NarL